MRVVLTRTPCRLLPLVWVVTLVVASGAATPRLRAVHRESATRASAQRLSARPGERPRAIAPDPDHGALSSHAGTGGEPRGPRRLVAVVPPAVALWRPEAVTAGRPTVAAVLPPHWSTRPRPARGPPA